MSRMAEDGSCKLLQVSVWMNSNENRVSNVTHLCRARVLVMTHFQTGMSGHGFATPVSFGQNQTEAHRNIKKQRMLSHWDV